MESLTIRVSRSTHELLRALAAKGNTTITAVVDEAAREFQRKQFWEDFQASCSALRADTTATADLDQEDAAWETTLADGFEGESLERATEQQPPPG
jgi:hypothetical protein